MRQAPARIPRALVLRRLTRAGVEVHRTGSGPQRVRARSASGYLVDVPPGKLSAEQIEELLAALGVARHEFEDMR